MKETAFPTLHLPITPPFAPMEAKLVEALPDTRGFQLEPKWDGFRCLAFRDGDEIVLQSKACQPLARYFPEVADNLRALGAKRFVLDGEIVIPSGDGLDFDALLQRIHPAESRIRRLARETPAVYIVFDLLVDARGRCLRDRPLDERRRALEDFASRCFEGHEDHVRLSPASTDRRALSKWERDLRGHGIDGVVAKRLDAAYASGERTMLKAKWMRTADCVVGGFRYATNDDLAGSLLLGLYDDDGLLHHVGFTTVLHVGERETLTRTLERMRKAPGFTGRAPGGPSRWKPRQEQ